MACMCELCVRNRCWRERGVPPDIIDYILDLEMDITCWKTIKDGSWPQGKSILLKILEKYK